MDLALAAVVGCAVLWVPGAILRRVLTAGGSDRTAQLARELALGLAFWPVLFLFTSLVGWSWTAAAARLFFALLVLVLIVLLAKDRRPRFQAGAIDAIQWAALFIAALAVFTRIRHIDGMVLPLWVDSVHHTMIVRLLIDHGRLPESYAPFIPQSAFYYHWGFHAVTAFVGWISGLTTPLAIPRLLLGFGQLLNALMFVAVYHAGLTLLRSRPAALLGATLATLVSLFPAYYVSWGRYTQLCGLLLLPPLAAAVWRLGRHPTPRRWMEVACLGAGLLLIHVRVAIVFAILAVILWAILAAQRRWNGLRWCATAGAAALLVASPWLVHLARAPQVRTILAPAAAERAVWETSNAAPDDILWAPHNALLFSLATGGLLGLAPFPLPLATRITAIAWWLLLVLLLQRRSKRKARQRRDGWRLGILAAWMAITALLINLDWFGLPRLNVLSNSAAVIMLFLPVSLAIAALGRWVSEGRKQMIAISLIAALAGASQMLHIVNPVTVLATSADRRALEWIAASIPQDARFAVGVQPWIGGSYIGVDGGYWIPLLAGRDSLLPPGLYPWVMPAARVAAITRTLGACYEAQQTGDTSVLDTLRRDGATHFYFGERNDTPLRRSVAGSALVVRVYAAEGVEIYALR